MLRYRGPMGHNRYVGFIDEHNRGFLVAFTLHWEVIEVRRVDPADGASIALKAFIEEYETNGWLAESEPSYGFVFMNREGVRILVEATPRDPFDKSIQTFNPFQGR